MRARLAWLCWCFCLGCQALPRDEARPGPAESPWEMGQKAMRAGNADEAITFYQEGLSQGQTDNRYYLSLGAAYVAKGDDARAAWALEHFLESNPGQHHVRIHYAGLLRKLARRDQALAEFERAVVELQEEKNSPYDQLVHCHCRLMEMAEERDDEFLTHLHRGIALYWLAQVPAEETLDVEEVSSEALLCRAASELTMARELRPGEARTSWYLYSAWHSLGQSQLAQRFLRDAREQAPFSQITPSEARSLQLAAR